LLELKLEEEELNLQNTDLLVLD